MTDSTVVVIVKIKTVTVELNYKNGVKFMSVRKRFDKDLFEKYDKKAKRIAKEFYENRGFTTKDNTNRYGVDLILYRDDEHVGFLETEVKAVWKDEPFPYESVQFPERKLKYIIDNDKPVTFFMLNAKCNRCLVVEGKDLMNSPLKKVWNKYMRGGNEMFFQVPLDKVSFHDLEQKK